MKKETEILKHELKIVELKMSLKKNGGKIDSKLKVENVDLRSQLRKVTSKLESIKLEHAKLEKKKHHYERWVGTNQVETWEIIYQKW